jgi:hypothetical protein
MRAKLIPATSLLWLSTALALLAGGELRAQAADMKFQAFLLWGTDSAKPPTGKTYQPAAVEIRQKLKELPIKWTNWFEVNRKDFTVLQTKVSEVAMSEKCRVNVKKLGDSEVEVCLIGKGKMVMNRRQSLPKGELLVLGGNAPNSTAWLVVLKRVE